MLFGVRLLTTLHYAFITFSSQLGVKQAASVITKQSRHPESHSFICYLQYSEVMNGPSASDRFAVCCLSCVVTS